MHLYRQKTIIFLLSLLLIFFIVFLVAFINLKMGTSILHLGMGSFVENFIVMFFAFLSILKVIFELYKVEHPKDFEERVKYGY